jgi:hypothetical protein
MPQLWTETIVTQNFWLIVIIIGFYYIAVTKLIPQIAFTLKARRTLETETCCPRPKGAMRSGDVLINSSKTLLSSILTPQSNPSSASSAEIINTSIANVRSSWIKCYI